MTVTDIPVDQVLTVRVETVLPSADNVRSDLGDVGSLAESIKAVGVLQPLIVTPVDQAYHLPVGAAVQLLGDDEQLYEVRDGHRRLAACLAAGVSHVPVLVRPLSDDERTAAREGAELMLIANLQREGLSPLDEAGGYHRLVELGYTQRDVATRVGCSQSHVSKRLALLLLPDDVRARIGADDSTGITIEQATALAALHHEPDRIKRVLNAGGRFESVLRNELAEAKREKRRAQSLAEVEAAGVPLREHHMGLDVLGARWGVELEPDAHAGEPCHAATIGHDGDITWLCLDRDRHRPSGDSELKAPNLSDPEPKPPCSSPGRMHDADTDHLWDSDTCADEDEPDPFPTDGLALALEDVAPPAEPTPQQPPAHVVESARLAEAERARATAVNDARSARWERMRGYLEKGKPTKGDVVRHLARQLVDDEYIADMADRFLDLLGLVEPSAAANTDGVDALTELVDYVEGTSDHQTKFLLAFSLLLLEQSRLLSGQAYRLTAGCAADDGGQLERHYELLRDWGYRPTPAELELYQPPADQADETAGDAEPPAAAGDAGESPAETPRSAGPDPEEALAKHGRHVWTDGGREPHPAGTLPCARCRCDLHAYAGDVRLHFEIVELERGGGQALHHAVRNVETAALDAREPGAGKTRRDAAEAVRRDAADFLACGHEFPGDAASQLSEILDAYHDEINARGPINTTKNGADDLYRFDPFYASIVMTLEGTDPLPEPLRSDILHNHLIRFNRRADAPNAIIPALTVEDLIDAYLRRVGVEA